MIRPDVDGRLAEKLRQIAGSQTDSWVSVDGISGILSGAEKASVLNIAADVFEEYILAALAAATPSQNTEARR